MFGTHMVVLNRHRRTSGVRRELTQTLLGQASNVCLLEGMDTSSYIIMHLLQHLLYLFA